MKNRNFSKFKKATIAALCAVSVTCTGLAAACAPSNEPEEPSDSKTQREDNQLLKNGNFEFSTVPEDAVHLIKNVNNWSRSGDSSGVMSGIVNTSKSAWELLTADDIKDKLDYNNDLSTSDPDYNDLHVDYNGMDSEDLLYVDSYAASFKTDGDVTDSDDIIAIHGTYKDFLGIEGDEESGYTYLGRKVYKKVQENPDEENAEFYFDEDCTKPVRYAMIENPETHLGAFDENAKTLGSTKVYLDDDGNYFLDEELTESVGNVLMIHNYPSNSKYNGIEQHYTSQSISLEANTAAEISVWVKTADLKFDKGFFQNDDENRGAYIEVTQSVASTAIDSFKIRAINTEKILADESVTPDESVSSNGWLKYTVYVNACDFADSTVTINLGLGDSENSQKVTGYAFFDDVEVKKFIDLDDEGCTYPENESVILDKDKPSYCSLTSAEEEKIFIADREVRNGDSARYSDRFHYLIDLASENIEGVTDSKTEVRFDSNELKATVALTTEEKTNGKLYASALKNGAKLQNFTSSDRSGYVLPEGLEYTGGRPTFNDLIGIYGFAHDKFSAADFNGTDADGLKFRDLSDRLNAALSGEKGLSALNKFSYENGNMVVMLSAYGAAYTATIENNDATDNSAKLFSVDGYANSGSKNYKIISFWVKTSDTDGTPATVRLIDASDKDNSASFSISTKNVTTDVGDSKDIYNGWVQCFFFVHNDTKEQKDFKLEFSYGNTAIADTTSTSYSSGWIAMANMQSLDVTEEVFNLVSEGSYAKTLNFNEEEEKSGNAFDSANGMTNVKTDIASPSTYNGVNGGSSYVTDKTFGDDYDKQNNSKNGITGLINREHFEDYDEELKTAILKAFKPDFTSAVGAWNEVFGGDCYQPLIIVDSLRKYRNRAKATEDNFKQYYIKDDNGDFVQVSSLPEEEQKFDEEETYYTEEELVKNYGYIGSTQTISANSYKTISVKVLVSGDAEAYIYLVNPSTRNVLKYETPSYTFHYDTEGNVLNKEYDEDWTETEHRDAIVYNLRDDGLYEDKDGKIFANLYNLTPRFKYKNYEHDVFYEKQDDGSVKRVSYDDLQDGVLYYSDEKGEKLANHYLCVDEQRIYEYDAETQKYYYMVGGKRDVEVNNFDPAIARYSYDKENAPEYFVKITNTDGKWVTVNFIIHSGSSARDYRLELWSGSRENTGITNGKDTPVNGAVAFDYSSANISDSNFTSVLSFYEQQIKDVYKELILEKDASKLTDEVTSIADYEKVLGELGITEADKAAALKAAGVDPDFEAMYYTFTLYDSAKFVPFNKNTAENGQTGYDYSIDDNSETLTYFKTRNENENSYNVFVDYSAIDQTVSLNTADDEEDNDDSSSDTAQNNGGSGWLLITSLIFALVMLFALAAVLVRYLLKKHSVKRSNKKIQKNNYKQRERYIRRYKIEKNAPAEDEAKGEAEAQPEAASEEPAEEPTEAPEEETSETPAEETEAPESAEETTEESGETTEPDVPDGESNDDEGNKE